MKKREGVDADFVSFLADRGVAHHSAAPYLTHVKKILRSVNPLTADAINEFLESTEMSDAYRSTMRVSWRAWVRFNATKGIELSDLTSLVVEPPSVDIIAAIWECKNAGVSLTQLTRMTWNLGAPIKGLEDRIVFAYNGKMVPLPKLAVETLRNWGHDEVSISSPLIPRKRNSKSSISAETLGRWLKQ